MCRAVSRETENDAKSAKNLLNSGVFGDFFLRIKPEKQAKNKFDPFLRENFTEKFCVFLPNFSGCFVTQIFYNFLFVSQCSKGFLVCEKQNDFFADRQSKTFVKITRCGCAFWCAFIWSLYFGLKYLLFKVYFGRMVPKNGY